MKKVKIVRENFILNPGNKTVGDEVEVNEKLADELIVGGFVIEVKEAKKPNKTKEEDR